jgi:hypothetical protein
MAVEEPAEVEASDAPTAVVVDRLVGKLEMIKSCASSDRPDGLARNLRCSFRAQLIGLATGAASTEDTWQAPFAGRNSVAFTLARPTRRQVRVLQPAVQQRARRQLEPWG